MITDPAAIRFVNEIARPRAEKLRALAAELNDELVLWNSGVNALFADGSAVVVDGRSAEGVSVLTGNDVINLVTQMNNLATVLNVANVNQVIAKPCVRSLSVNVSAS